MPPKPHEDPSSPAKPKRRKRRLTRLGITALVLVVLALVINGPGARWLVGKVLRDQLTKQELAGDFAVAGTLASGFTLTGLELTGTGPLRKVSADTIKLQWRLTKLRNKQFDLVAVEGVRVEIFPEKDKEDEPKGDWRDIFESLRKFRDIAISGEIRLSDIQVTVLGEAGARQITLASLRHAAGSGEFQVEGFFPGNLLPEPPPVQDFTVQWNENDLVLSGFSVTPGLSIAGFTINYPAGSPINAATTLDFLEKNFEVNASEAGTIVIRSGETPLDLAKVLEVLGLDYPLEGQVAELSINLQGLLEAPAQWQGDLAIRADDLVWNETPVPSLSLTGQIEDSEVIVGLKAGDELVVLRLASELPATRDGRPQWEGHKVVTDLKVRSMSEFATLALKATGQEIPAALPHGQITVQAPLTLSESGVPETIDFEWSTREVTYRDQEIPALTGSGRFADQKLSARAAATLATAGDKLEVGGGYDLGKKSYHGDLTLSLRDPAWLGRLALAGEKLAQWRPVGPLVISWKGTGSIVEKTHSGSYHVETVSVKAPEESTTNASLKGAYAWPESVTAETIAIRNGELQLSGGVKWSPHIVTFANLVLEDGDGELATIDGRSPANPDLKALFQTEEPIALTVKSQKLTLDRIRSLVPLPLDEAYQATIDADLKLTGPPAEPSLQGTLDISGIKTPVENAPTLALATSFVTADGRLTTKSTLSDEGGILARLDVGVPVDSKQWAENPDALKSLPFTASLKTDSLNFERLKSLTEALEGAEGSIDLDLTAGGTVSAPTYSGNVDVHLQELLLPGTPHKAIRDTHLQARLEPGLVTIIPSTCTIAGGTMILSGSAKYGGETPAFDITLTAENALLWRDDLLVARTSGSLNLKGTPAEARLSGALGLVDSLVFKDIELIPLRPATTVAPPALPSFSTRGAKDFSLPIPEPMANWTVAVDIFTQNPFLIRGNLASGEATGRVSVGGTLSKPRPSGRIDLRNAVADLPFSKLTISKGAVVLRPDHPTNPAIEATGRTVVDNHDIKLFVYGPVSALKYNLSSDPPLPESEIMSLVSTGTTTEGLTDPDLAQARAFQLFLDDARRRANSAEAGTTMKLLKGPLNAVDDLNLKVGQNDPYSGRRFNSATLELTDRWSATIQLDDEGNTRGLLRRSIRSK